jgi:hypothetical protein
VPDLAAFWISSPQRNLLSSDWPQDVELGSDGLLERVEHDLSSLRGEIVVIVEKYETSKLGSGLVPLSDSYNIVQFVKANFDNVGQTDFFEIYA